MTKLLNKIAAVSLAVCVAWVLFHGTHQMDAVQTDVTKPVQPDVAPIPPPEPDTNKDQGSPAEDCEDCTVKPLPEGPVADDGPANEAVDVSQFVHRINVWHGNESDQGSATHIGGGRYATCDHVFTDDNGHPWRVSRVQIDGRNVNSQWHRNGGVEFVVVQTDAIDFPAARTNVSDLSVGQQLSVCGQKTGIHLGVVSANRYRSGHMTMICPAPNTENGDSGAGVFNEAGELVGVHWGSLKDEVFFTQIAQVASQLGAPQAPAAIGPHTPSAPSAADNGFAVTRHSDGRWWWNDGAMDRWTSQAPAEGMLFRDGAASFIYHDGRMLTGDLILEFGADWCAPCRAARQDIAPKLKANGWTVVYVDDDQNKQVSRVWGIKQLPTFIVVRDGKEVSRTTGAVMPVPEGAAPQSQSTAEPDGSLAGQLVQHCSTDNKSAGYAAIVGTTLNLADLVAPKTGSPILLASGVTLTVPRECRWRTSKQSDGSVKFTFSDPLPTVTARKSFLRVNPEISDVTVRLEDSSCEVQAALKRFPDFTLTVALANP